MLFRAKLHHDLELSAVNRALVSGVRRAPRVADNTVKFSPHDRQHDFVGTRVSTHGLQPGAKKRIERSHENLLVSTRTGRPELQADAIEDVVQVLGGTGL